VDNLADCYDAQEAEMVKAKLAAFIAGMSLMVHAQVPPSKTPDATALLKVAAATLGAENLKSVEFFGNGWDACLGQAWSVNDGRWARWELRDYNRVIDYETVSSRHTAQQRAGMDAHALGGCGAAPGQAARPQQSTVTADSPWVQQLQVWLTPYGFIRLANQNKPAAETQAVAGRNFNVVSFAVSRGNQTYRMKGYFNAENILERIETWLDDPVFGDMLVEAEFSGYRNFDGLRFPARILQKQGGLGIFELAIDKVVPNSTASTAPPQAAGPRGGGAGGGGRGAAPAAAPTPPLVEMGPGVFVLDGAYQAVAVAFNDYSVVIDGMQNEARTRAVIEQTKKAIPGKPIRYVVVTHSHFDHVTGLRDFMAEGATIITHEMNVKFFERALGAPRTLNASPDAKPSGKPKLQGVGDRYVLQDGKQSIELHRIRGHVHADDMLIAYIPSVRTIVESDLVQPWINPQFSGGPGPNPYLVHLANELDRLKLNYESFVSIHRPNPPPTVSRAALMTAIGRN
jgi:glyoxylase-like metal-dependent hydrolase (beta-lactamase superfamily II)